MSPVYWVIVAVLTLLVVAGAYELWKQRKRNNSTYDVIGIVADNHGCSCCGDYGDSDD